MANSEKGTDEGAGVEKPGDEPVDLDDELDAMSDDPGDDGNPLLQQNL